MRLYFKDTFDGFYQFSATAPQEYYAHLIPVTQVQYDLANPKTPQLSPAAVGREHELHEFRELRAEVLNALNGIAQWDISPTDTITLNAMVVARQALKDIPAHPTVVAAVTGAETRTAIMAIYNTVAANLAAISQPASVAFL